MISILLANWRAAAVAILIAIPTAYAAVMKLRFEHTKAEYTQYRAEVSAAAAEAEIRNANVAIQEAKNAQEALDDMQTRYVALDARYKRVRNTSASSGVMPAVSSATAIVASEPAGQSDAATRCLAILEIGDRELAKYRALWTLEERNASK